LETKALSFFTQRVHVFTLPLEYDGRYKSAIVQMQTVMEPGEDKKTKKSALFPCIGVSVHSIDAEKCNSQSIGSAKISLDGFSVNSQLSKYVNSDGDVLYATLPCILDRSMGNRNKIKIGINLEFVDRS
jgi:hypothetical protein